MPNVVYRMFFNDEPATREQLDRVEEVTVEQQVDAAWEARVQVPVCTDENGKWEGEDEPFLRPDGRVRVEVKVGKGRFVPLIDGPVVGRDSDLSSDPGRMTLVVRDDSVLLNRAEEVGTFENLSDHEIAKQLFRAVPQIADVDVEPAAAPPAGLPPVEVQRGTPMDVLRRLAARQGMHAYVSPGRKPGKSVGCFKKFPKTVGDLPALVLMGADRNIAEFNVSNDTSRPGQTEAYSLSVTDKVVTHAKTSVRDLKLLVAEPPPGSATTAAGRRLLPPGADDAADARQRVAAEAERAAFAFEVRGSIRGGGCYDGVLLPYEVITVKGANDRLSGNYVIKKVTHRLTRSEYAQSFSLLRDARSAGAGGGIDALKSLIF